MLIAGIVIAIVVVAAVAVYAASLNSPNPSASPSPTATTQPSASTSPSTTSTPQTSTSPSSQPTTTPTIVPTQTANPSSPPNVTAASSLQYSVSMTSNGTSQGSYTYYGKNAGTSNFMMRIESTDASGAQSTIIVNGQQQKVWVKSNGNWTDLSSVYTTYFSTWDTTWQSYVNTLAAWNGTGDYTYTSGGDSIRIYNISVNPALADSLFAPS